MRSAKFHIEGKGVLQLARESDKRFAVRGALQRVLLQREERVMGALETRTYPMAS